jgi:hypothetical protein
MFHLAPGSGRIPKTQARVLREPELVPVELIRPTNKVSRAVCRVVEYSPICLVNHPDGFLYIVDGNHRFYKKAKFEKESSKIAAWILREGDQERLVNDRLPAILVQWKTGEITLEELTKKAHFQANYFVKPRQPRSRLNLASPKIKAKAGFPSLRDPVREETEWPANRKFELVIQLIKEKISIDEASSKYSLPTHAIEEWIHVSIRAIRDALEDKSEDTERGKTG